MKNTTLKRLKNGTTQFTVILENDADLVSMVKRINLSGNAANSARGFINNFEERINDTMNVYEELLRYMRLHNIIDSGHRYIGSES